MGAAVAEPHDADARDDHRQLRYTDLEESVRAAGADRDDIGACRRHARRRFGEFHDPWHTRHLVFPWRSSVGRRGRAGCGARIVRARRCRRRAGGYGLAATPGRSAGLQGRHRDLGCRGNHSAVSHHQPAFRRVGEFRAVAFEEVAKVGAAEETFREFPDGPTFRFSKRSRPVRIRAVTAGPWPSVLVDFGDGGNAAFDLRTMWCIPTATSVGGV